MKHWSEDLIRMNACSEAVAWAKTQPDLETAWAVCERADWMLWLVGSCDTSAPWSEERKPLVRCSVACAAEVLRYAPEGEAREAAEACISITQAWCEGAVTREDAASAAYAAYAASAAYAAYAASAAYTAYADAAADAVAAAADAAADASAAPHASRTLVLRELCAIVRSHYPSHPSIGGAR